MAGISTRYAIDHDKDACRTFAANHPEAEVLCADVLTIDPADLPDADLIVGGPPCVNFSTSKGSRANVLDGLRLVQWFLRVVAIKKPRYWIMENVPRVADHLPRSIPLDWIGISGGGLLEVPVRCQLNAADFGVAQARKRYLIGNFPSPKASHKRPMSDDLLGGNQRLAEWRTLRTVLECLPDPLSARAEFNVRDPIYEFEIPCAQLTDHFLDTVLTDEQAADLRAVKQMHPYMGRMAFPDDIDRPARTVVATQLGRETLVLACSDGRFRRATVRECASIQSFPVTYQFLGKSLTSRYRQAGDAVPPLLSFAIAREVTGCLSPDIRIHNSHCYEPITTPLRSKRAASSVIPRRKFSAMIPGKEVRGSRVELDNINFSRLPKDVPESDFVGRIWCARLHLGEGRVNSERISLRFDLLFGHLMAMRQFCSPTEWKAWLGFCASLLGLLEISFDANEMQALWSKNIDQGHSANEMARSVTSLVNTYFPSSDYSGSRVLLDLPQLRDSVRLRTRLFAAAIGISALVDAMYGDSAVKAALATMSPQVLDTDASRL